MGPMQYQTDFREFGKPFKNAKLAGESNTGANCDSQSCADGGPDSAQAGTGEGNTPRNACLIEGLERRAAQAPERIPEMPDAQIATLAELPELVLG
jgi:hypothetical protein